MLVELDVKCIMLYLPYVWTEVSFMVDSGVGYFIMDHSAGL